MFVEGDFIARSRSYVATFGFFDMNHVCFNSALALVRVVEVAKPLDLLLALHNKRHIPVHTSH